MELKIKILEIIPNIKTLKLKQSDIISLTFIAENFIVKIDNIEKSMITKEYVLLLLREYSPNERIHFNLIKNDVIIIGTGKLTPSSGIKWYKIYDLVSATENNVNYSSKTLSKKNININDSLINSNIKIKLETHLHMVKNKSKLKASSKKINFSNSKNKTNVAGLINMDEKSNNSIISSNLNSNFNKFKLNQNINSYTATPGIKSPRYTHLLTRTKTNNTNNNNNDSSRDNTLKENHILQELNFEKEKLKKNSVSRRTPSGKKFLCQNKKFKTLYGFNKPQCINKNKSTEKSLDNNIIIENNKGKKMSTEIEEKILDQNFKDIIKYDEILRGKEITDFNLENNNIMNNLENNKNITNESNNIVNNIEVIKNTNNENNKDKKINNKEKKINFNIDNKNINKNTNINANQILINNINKNIIKNNKNINTNINIKNNNNIFYEFNNSNNNNIHINNELDNNNLKNEFNNIIQNSVVSSALSSGRIINSGCDIDLSAEDLSGSFSAYDNISKMLIADEYKITYDIKNENIYNYENIKNDFILFYNKEYINSINEEMLILELQLMIDKILEMQSVYKRQSLIIQKNFELYKNKLLYFQRKNLLMNKKMNKLLYEKLKNKYNQEINDLYYNNKKLNFYKNKNIFKENELSLWNNIKSHLNEDEVNKKKSFDTIKKKLQNIFLIICNKNINNLNTLSKKYVLEFIEKEKKKEKEKEKEKEKIKSKLSNTFNNFYKEKKSDGIADLKNKKIRNSKNSSRKYINNSNRNDNLGYKSNKLIKSNDTGFRKEYKKDIFQIQEIVGDENSLNNNEKEKKIKVKSNDFGGFNNRNNLNKNCFNTVKSLTKKYNKKK